MPNIVTADEIRAPPDDSDLGDQDERAAVQAAKDVAARRQAEQDRQQAVLNIQAHRDDRLYQQAIQGRSISEQSRDESSAAEWVNRLKSQGPALPAAAKRPRPMAPNQPQPELRIRHDVDEIADGETLVLTLKDRRIGDADNDDDDDELENLQLVEQRKLERNLDRKAKRTRPAGEDDQALDEARPVLDKYDQVRDELDAKKGGMVLTSTGSVVDRAAAIRAKLAAPLTTAKQHYDFGSNSSRLPTNDFYTKAEMASFKAPTLKKKKKTTKAARRTIITDETEAGSGQGPSVDHGTRDTSRASIRSRIEASQAEMQKKRERFDIAVAKSDARSHTLVDAPPPFVFEDDAEDIQLQEALAQANRAARRAQEQRQRQAAADRKPLAPTPKITAVPTPNPDTEGIVFSTASEFMTNVRANASERAPRPNPAAAATDPTPDPVESSDDADDMDMDETAPTVKVEPKPAGATPDDHDDDALDFMNDVIDNGKGISGALKLIRSRGLTGAKALPPLIAGRARDAPVPEHKDPAPHLRLDRVDEFGRPLTMKESFRELSYRFHGHRPGAKKREKMLKELQQQLKLQESISGRAATSTQRLADVSAKAGRHYVVMDSKTGAFGKVATQKLAIGTEDDDLVSSTAPDLDDRAYVAGSKKVEFAIGKTD